MAPAVAWPRFTAEHPAVVTLAEESAVQAFPVPSLVATAEVLRKSEYVSGSAEAEPPLAVASKL